MPDGEDITTPYAPGQAPAPPPAAAPSAADTALAAAQNPDRSQAPVQSAQAGGIAQAPMEGLQDLSNMKKESIGSRIYHGILSALGGGTYVNDPTVTPNGVVNYQMKQTPGQQWKRIIAGAVAGAGGALQNAGTGPGNEARAVAGGIQAGTNLATKTAEGQRAQADEQFKQQQQAAMQSAQIAHMNTQKLMLDFQLSQAQKEADENEIKTANQTEQLLAAAGPGSHRIDHFATLQDAINAAHDSPELHDQHAGGPTGAQLMYVSRFKDGKHDGVDAYLVTPDWKNAKYQGTIKMPRTEWKDGKVSTTWEDVPPGSVTNEAAYNMLTAISNENKQNALTESEIEKNKGETGIRQQELTLAKRRDAREEALAPLEQQYKQAAVTALVNKDPYNEPVMQPGQYDPQFPPVSHFARGTPGIDVKAINKGLDANDQKTELLANNVVDNADQAKAIINSKGFPTLTGTADGRVTQLKQWLGTNDPRISKLNAYVDQMALASVGIHGSKSRGNVQDYRENILRDWTNGPAAASGAIDASVGSSKNFLTQIQNKRMYGTPNGPDRSRETNAGKTGAQGQAAPNTSGFNVTPSGPPAGGQQFSVNVPGQPTLYFPTQAAADDFKRLARIP